MRNHVPGKSIHKLHVPFLRRVQDLDLVPAKVAECISEGIAAECVCGGGSGRLLEPGSDASLF